MTANERMPGLHSTTEPRFEPRPNETQLYHELFPDSAKESVEQYAHRLTEVMHTWYYRDDVRMKALLQFVADDFQKIYDTASPDEIAQAEQVLVDYGNQLPNRAESSSKSWLVNLQRLGSFGCANNVLPIMERPHDLVEADENTWIPHGDRSDAFWYEVYLKTVGPRRAAEASAQYLQRGGIEQKNPAILQAAVEVAQGNPEQPSNEPEARLDRLTMKNANEIMRAVYDGFRMLVNEAADAGWTNAKVVQHVFNSLPKRDIPHHIVLIETGNQVMKLMQKHGHEPTQLRPGKLELLKIDNLSESIQRCMYLMFERGQDPAGHDPLNYILTGQLLAALSKQIKPVLEHQE